MTWKKGQILYRISWVSNSREPAFDVSEYIVERATPAGGWIYETDCYYGLKKPDRSKSNFRPFCDATRIWRKATGNYAHATLAAAKESLAARTKRHHTILKSQLHTVQLRLRTLYVPNPEPQPRRFLWDTQ